MRRRQFTILMAASDFTGLFSAPAQAAISEADAVGGVRLALERGARSAVSLLGRKDGFLTNPKVRIPLPGALESTATLPTAAGQQCQVDEIVTAMNRAAEAAVPEAKSLLIAAVKSMSVEDGLKIVRGGDPPVTDFFATKTRQPLGEKLLPIVTRATEMVARAAKHNAVTGKAVGLGLVKKEDANVEQYVTGKQLDGPCLYLMIGEDERKIRRDPVATGSEILKKVFGR